MPKNLSLFDIITTKALGECFESFPIPCTFNALDFCKSDDNNCERVVYHTFKWLSDNEYIRFAKVEMGKWPNILDVELTEKGLRILHEKVDVLGFNGSLGTLMKKACKAGGEALVSEAVKLLFAFGSHINL